jgi:hypothetical protein
MIEIVNVVAVRVIGDHSLGFAFPTVRRAFVIAPIF